MHLPAVLFAAIVLPALMAQTGPTPRVVDGRVLGPSSQPVPAADVWVTRLEDPANIVARTHTDGSGRFRVRADARGLLAVHATAPGLTQATCRDDPRRPGGTRAVLTLWPAATVRGRVRDHDGSPVPGAVVAVGLALHLGVQCDTVQTTTDRDGRYLLEHAPPGEVWVSAWTPIRPLASRPVLLQPGRDEDLDFANEEPLALELTLTGLPAAAGLRCVLMNPDVPLPPALLHHVFDQDNRLRVSGMPADQSLEVFVLDPGNRWSCQRRVWSRSERGPLEVPCTPTARRRWEVTVLQPDDKPLADARIVLGLGDELAMTDTNAAGEAAIEAKCGADPRGTAWLQSDAWVLDTTDEMREPAPWYYGDGQDVVLRAVRAARVRGQIVDAAGKPVAASDVVLEEHNGSRGPRWRQLAHARSGDDGSFAMRGVLPIQRELRLRIEDTGTLLLLHESLASGETLELGTVTAAPSGVLEGVVEGASGRPIPGARLCLRQAGQPQTGDMAMLLCDGDGRFRFAPAANGAWIASMLWRDGEQDMVGRAFTVADGATLTLRLRSARH